MGRRKRTSVKFCTSIDDPYLAELLKNEGLASKVQLINVEQHNDIEDPKKTEFENNKPVKSQETSPLRDENIFVSKTAGSSQTHMLMGEENPMLDSFLDLELAPDVKNRINNRYKLIKRALLPILRNQIKKHMYPTFNTHDDTREQAIKELRHILRENARLLLDNVRRFEINLEKDELRTKEFNSVLSAMEQLLITFKERKFCVESQNNECFQKIIQDDLCMVAEQFNRIVIDMPSTQQEDFNTQKDIINVKAKILNNKRRSNKRFLQLYNNTSNNNTEFEIFDSMQSEMNPSPRTLIHQFLT
ncbi:hypothetical protein PCE1_004105 [Barthelona sp. PCE]